MIIKIIENAINELKNEFFHQQSKIIIEIKNVFSKKIVIWFLKISEIFSLIKNINFKYFNYFLIYFLINKF